MRVVCHDALTCDFAQYYHLYDLEAIPLTQGAILACGLPPESRTMRKLTNTQYTAEQAVLMGILDSIRSFEYAYVCSHSKKKPQKPRSVFDVASGTEEVSELTAFDSAEDFEVARQKIIQG